MTAHFEEFKPVYDRSPDRWVYHFTKQSTAFEKILATQEIRLNPLEVVNDPKESRLDGFFAKSKAGNASEEHTKFAGSVRDYLRTHVNVFCATRDYFSGAEVESDRSLRQACFKPAMWAHYGDLHRGVCLVFDRENLESSILSQVSPKPHIFGNVDYQYDLFNMCYAIDEEEFQRADDDVAMIARHRFDTNYRELLLRKHLDWQYESEWRAVVLQEQSGALHIPYGNALKAIVVGMNFPPVYPDLVRSLAWQNDARAYRVTWTISQWNATNLMEVPTKWTPSEAQKLRKEIGK